MQEELFTPQQAAQSLDVDKFTVYRLGGREGYFSSYGLKIGKQGSAVLICRNPRFGFSLRKAQKCENSAGIKFARGLGVANDRAVPKNLVSLSSLWETNGG